VIIPELTIFCNEDNVNLPLRIVQRTVPGWNYVVCNESNFMHERDNFMKHSCSLHKLE